MLPIFALSDAVWSALIILAGIAIKEFFLDRKRAQDAEAVRAAQGKTLQTVVEDVKKIEVATNSMKDKLVAKTEAEALARGGVEERSRADARADAKESETEDHPDKGIRGDIAAVPEKTADEIERREKGG